MQKILLLFAICSTILLSAPAQTLRTPAPSVPQFIRQDFGLSNIELSYSRPGVKGRKIFGDLVPYGKVWRTGANQATTLTFGDTITIGGTIIPPGKYGLLTIPGADQWTFIITRQTDVTSPAAYRQDQDIVRVQASPHTLPFAVETMTLEFSNLTGGSCNLDLLWDNVAVGFPISTNTDAKVMTQINNTLVRDSRPYYQAAFYYLENGKDLNKALEWFDKAIAQDPTAYFAVYQKARCLAKLGRKQEAIAAAKQSMDLAKQQNNNDYVALNQKLIESLQ
ncbi:MAG TPA: DUF2911 domain-containing protein [Puia sp.]|jgi:hypothetical protein|nr:DUF2911 domain-containing protein [Puia sp.]